MRGNRKREREKDRESESERVRERERERDRYYKLLRLVALPHFLVLCSSMKPNT